MWDTAEDTEGEVKVGAGGIEVDEGIENEDVGGMERGLGDHGMESSSETGGREEGGSSDGEGEGEVVREVGGGEEEAGEEDEGEVGPGMGRGGVGTDKDVPSVEVWLRDLIEQAEGVGEVAEGGEGDGGEEHGGGVRVGGKEVETEHEGVDLLESGNVKPVALVVVFKKPQYWMVPGAAVSGFV